MSMLSMWGARHHDAQAHSTNSSGMEPYPLYLDLVKEADILAWKRA